MTPDIINRYIWLIDTVRQYGSISRAELSKCWMRSTLSDGRPLVRRTLYNYRQAIQQMFNIDIRCNPATNEYYIAEEGKDLNGLTQWLVNSNSVSRILSSATEVADKVFLEEVPSSNGWLAVILEALKENRYIKFDYQSFSKSAPAAGIVFEPYLVKLFRQRWYLTGRPRKGTQMRTYALDRITDLKLLPETFEPDPDFDGNEYFKNSFGIVVTSNQPRKIVIRSTPRQAKYFRALPLHHTQQETIHDDYSLFTLRMRLSDDFVEELLRYGSEVEVLEPQELRTIMATRLRQAAALYELEKSSTRLSDLRSPYYF